jgi:hypothetical protein
MIGTTLLTNCLEHVSCHGCCVWKRSYLQLKIVDDLILRKTFPFSRNVIWRTEEALLLVLLFNDVNRQAVIRTAFSNCVDSSCYVYMTSFLLT